MARRDYKEFAAGETHHAFNRGNDKMDIFRDERDYRFFLSRLEEALYPSRNTPVNGHHSHPQDVNGAHSQRNQRKALPPESFDLVAYCLMPNHFHLLVLQKTDLPISVLMLKLITSYSKYFNKKYERVGSLFQDQYKSTRIADNTQLLHTSAYIHNNPRTDGLVEAPESYPYSSFQEYLLKGDENSVFAEPKIVMEQFADPGAYRDFVYESFDVTKRNKE